MSLLKFTATTTPTPLNSTCNLLQGDAAGYAILATCTGTPPTTADIFQHGCLMYRTDSGTGTAAVYQNTGSTAVPSWVLMDTAATSLQLPEAATDSTTTTTVSLDLTQNAVTTGVGFKQTLNGLTTGFGHSIVHTTAVIANGGSLQNISSTSIDTSTTTGILQNLSSTASLAGTQVLWTFSGLTTGIGHSIVANALTTGTVSSISATGLSTGKIASWSASSNSTNGSTSVEPVLFSTTMTGVGGVGGRVRAYMTTNVALGAWSNALKGEVTYGAAGRTDGLGSAILAEMTLSAGTSSGNYALLEGELNLATGALTGTATSLIYLSVNGADAATFSTTNGYIMNLAGLTAGASNVFRTGLTAATINAATTAALKIKIGSTDYFIPIATATA